MAVTLPLTGIPAPEFFFGPACQKPDRKGGPAGDGNCVRPVAAKYL